MPNETDTPSTADLHEIIKNLEAQITALANTVAELSARAATTDEIQNSTQPLADQIATMNATIANLPAPVAAELSADDVKRNKWVDKVLSTWFVGDRPADEPSA